MSHEKFHAERLALRQHQAAELGSRRSNLARAVEAAQAARNEAAAAAKRAFGLPTHDELTIKAHELDVRAVEMARTAGVAKREVEASEIAEREISAEAAARVHDAAAAELQRAEQAREPTLAELVKRVAKLEGK